MSADELPEHVREIPVSREHQFVIAEIERYGAKAERAVLVKFLCVALPIAFVFGGLLASIKHDIGALTRAHERHLAETDVRLVDWTQWRRETDTSLEKRLSDRFTGENWNAAATIIMNRNKSVSIPYLWEIKQP